MLALFWLFSDLISSNPHNNLRGVEDYYPQLIDEETKLTVTQRLFLLFQEQELFQSNFFLSLPQQV